MAFFTKNLIHTVTYARPAATPDANGDPSYGSQTTAPAKVIGQVQDVRDAENQARTSTHTIYTEADVRVGDRIWVPFLGDDISNLAHARFAINVRSSPSLRGDSKLVAVFL